MNAAGLKAIESGNNRGLQFHVFANGVYQTSWRSLELAEAIAAKETSGEVYNDSAKRVFSADTGIARMKELQAERDDLEQNIKSLRAEMSDAGMYGQIPMRIVAELEDAEMRLKHWCEDNA